MSSSTKIDNREKDALILDKGPTEGLEHTLSAEKMYSINFTEDNKTFCLSLHYNGANSYLFVNDAEIHKFKEKDSEIVATPLCLGNITNYWSVDNIKKAALNGYVYGFSVDYNDTAVDDILDIHKHQMKTTFYTTVFFTTLMFFSCNLSSVNPLKCVSMSNQECKVRTEMFNVNSDEPLVFLFSLKTSKCNGSRNNINDPYEKFCVPDVLKNININVFNLMSRTNGTRHTEWHETFKSKCRQDPSVSNNKQRWSEDK